jgi:hypothetical protein
MNDEEVVRQFDGRGRVQLRLGQLDPERNRRVVKIAHALGYRQITSGNLNRWDVSRLYERDDAPDARRRAEQTIARLRAGGPVLLATEPPPPPPPPPAPPLTPRQSQPRPRRSLEPQPPPPVAPSTSRIPSRPHYPPRPSNPPPLPEAPSQED